MITLDANLETLRTLTTHRHATCWKLVRRDGVVLRFTDHDALLTVDDEIYTPAGGWNASARRKRDSLGGQDFDAIGVISSSAITTDDLRKGRYDGATIWEYLVDWMYPWAGVLRSSKYFISSIRYNGREWQVQLEGLTQKLKHRVGNVYGRTCRHTFGDTTCGILAEDYRSDGCSVFSVTSERKSFTAEHADFAGIAADWYNYGVLSWSTGSNQGVISTVEDCAAAVGSQIFFTLRMQLPESIQVGDTFSVIAGCDGLFATCSAKFDNYKNFGGFHFIPGPDKLLVSPW